MPSGRTSSLARPSQAWPMYGQGSATMLDGRPISYREIVTTQPWVSIAVNGIARQIARLPLKAFRRGQDGGRDRDRDSMEARALAKPSRNRTPSNLKYAIAVGLLADGNHVEEFVTIGGEPQLRPLDWRWLTPYLVDGQVRAWEYRPPQGDVRLLDADDVMHFGWEMNGGLGVSPLKALGITLRVEDASQKWTESNFRNGARMGVAVMFDKEVNADQATREALREEIEGRYTGPENAGRPLVLGGGVADVKEIGAQTPVEAALIDQRKLNREEVLGVYNWPPPVAGDLEHGTFSNVAELTKTVFRIVLPPWTGLIQETITQQLIAHRDPSEHYAEFDYNAALQGEPDARFRAYRSAVGAGILTLNDARELENMPRYDLEEADEPLVMSNNVAPLSQVVAERAAAALGAGEEE